MFGVKSSGKDYWMIWKKFQNIIVNDEDISDNWSDEAIERLWNDLKDFDENQTVTVELESMTDILDFSTKPE